MFVILALISFGTGYLVADHRADSLAAEKEFTALLHDVAAIGYLRKGAVDDAKNILYVAVDGQLSTFSSNQAATLSSSSREHLSKVLASLNQSWAADRPFEGEKSTPLHGSPEWTEMRKKNDAFRQNHTQISSGTAR